DLRGDARLKTNADRVKQREWLLPRLASIFKSHETSALAKTLERIGLPFAPIAKPWDLLDDAHLKASGGLLETRVGNKTIHATAQDRPPYGSDVTLEQAKKIAAGAIEESRKQNWRMAVAIVDNHGFLKYYEMMDDTQTASAQIAVDKAKTAAMYRRSSKVFED